MRRSAIEGLSFRAKRGICISQSRPLDKLGVTDEDGAREVKQSAVSPQAGAALGDGF